MQHNFFSLTNVCLRSRRKTNFQMKLESLKNVASLLSTKEMGSLVGGAQDLTRATNKDLVTGRSTDKEEGHYYETQKDGKCFAVWHACVTEKGDDGLNGTYYPASYEIPCNVIGLEKDPGFSKPTIAGAISGGAVKDVGGVITGIGNILA